MPSLIASADAVKEHWIRLALVVFVSLSYSIVLSQAWVFGWDLSASVIYQWDPEGLVINIAVASSALWFATCNLRGTGRAWRDLGFVFTHREIGASLKLLVVGLAGWWGTYMFAALWAHALFGGMAEEPDIGMDTYSTPLLVFILLNPFFEELIVRGYVATELRALTGSRFVALAGSVLLQLSYHTYQGVFAVIALGGLFTVFAYYYEKTGRLTPIVFCHLFLDVLGTMMYLE